MAKLFGNRFRTHRRTAVRHLMTTLVLAPAISLLATPAAAQTTLETPAGRTVQMVHWQAFYESLLSPVVQNPIDDIPVDTVPMPPSLRSKYDHTPSAGGMDLFATAEFKKLRARLPRQQATSLSGWTVIVARCTASGPALLTAVNRQKKQICLAPILLTSLFIESTGNDMIKLTTYLRAKSVDPASFSGAYETRLNQRGVTRADWDALLAGFAEPSWSRMQRSLDSVLARAIVCGAFSVTKPACNSQALSLARQIDDKVEVTSLISALQSAVSKYDPSSWGYEKVGDGKTVVTELQENSAP